MSSEIVQGWGAEFSLDGLLDDDLTAASTDVSMIPVETMGETMVDIEEEEVDDDMMEEMQIDHPPQPTGFLNNTPNGQILSEIRFKIPTKKETLISQPRGELMTIEEREINPQSNLSLKKQQKLIAKKMMKEARRAMNNEMHVDMD